MKIRFPGVLLAAWKLRSNLYSRQIMINSNIHEKNVSKSTNHLVNEVGRAFGVEVTDNDISVSHHLPLSKAYQSKKPAGPSPIIAKFV